MLTAEQVVAAQKANIETLFGLTNKAFEGVEKLVELNLQVAKAALGEVADTTRAALSVKDAQELLALQATMLQPAAEKAASYSRHLYDIAAATQAEVTKVAEAQFAEAQKSFASTVDTALKNAPAGSENAVALVKSAMATKGLVCGPIGTLARFVAVARHLESAALLHRARLSALRSVLHAAPEPHAQLHWLAWIPQ